MKSLISWCYNPSKENKNSSWNSSRNLPLYSSIYEVVVLGDFNVGIEESICKTFVALMTLNTWLKAQFAPKNPEKLRVIDLKLKNHPLSFLNSCLVKTGLSEFYKMVLNVFKMTLKRNITLQGLQKF